MRNYFVFDGKDSRDFGLYTNGLDTFGSPARRLNSVPVSGRSEDYVVNTGAHEQYDFAYKDCFIKPQRFELDLASLRSFLGTSGIYKRLEDSYHPDEFYYAYFPDGVSPDMLANLTMGSFDIPVRRKRERYLKSGEHWLTIESGVALHNDNFDCEAKPIIRVVGSGSITVGDISVVVASNTADHIDIDCEMMQSYAGTIPVNNLIELNNMLEYPVLGEGDTTITFTGFTSVKIKPRWWRL